MNFVKMHGIGNDYIYIDAVTHPEIEATFAGTQGAAMVRRMSDRHRGVGGDGVILVCRPAAGSSDDAHVRMRMFNADGSESEMCGNGVRCVAKFAHDRLGAPRELRVQTGRGVLRIVGRIERGKLVSATVDMGEPLQSLKEIPVDPAHLRQSDSPRRGVGARDWLLELESDSWAAGLVSMGNPHAVLWARNGEPLTMNDLGGLDLARLGPPLERHPAFPRRANIHWAVPQSRGEVTMRTWERGAGPTLACGTGACAVVVSGVLRGALEHSVLVHLPGGDLEVQWDPQSNHVLMTGPAEDAFEGCWIDEMGPGALTAPLREYDPA